MVQVMVDGNTTNEQLVEDLLDDFAYSHLVDRYFKDESYYDEYREAVNAWVDLYFVNHRGTREDMEDKWNTTLGVPEDEDDEWDCCSYFVIEDIDAHMVQKLRDKPNNCPVCDSEELLTEIQDGNIDIKVTCNSCQEGWVEHYVFEGATFNET